MNADKPVSVGFSLLDVSCQVARFVTGQMFTRLTGGEVDVQR